MIRQRVGVSLTGGDEEQCMINMGLGTSGRYLINKG